MFMCVQKACKGVFVWLMGGGGGATFYLRYTALPHVKSEPSAPRVRSVTASPRLAEIRTPADGCHDSAANIKTLSKRDGQTSFLCYV